MWTVADCVRTMPEMSVDKFLRMQQCKVYGNCNLALAMLDYSLSGTEVRLQKADTLQCCILAGNGLNTGFLRIDKMQECKNDWRICDMEQTTFEKLGIEYEEQDGLFYPLLDIGAGTNTNTDTEAAAGDGGNLFSADVGKYGRMWLRYMQENEPQRYRSLYRFGKLYQTAAEVNDEAYRMLDTISEKYLRKNLPQNPASTMELWRLQEQAKAEAEEVVIADIVMKCR